MNPRLSLVTLGVTDLSRSTTFYRDGLGLPANTNHSGITFLPLQGAWVALYPREALTRETGRPTGEPGGITLAHNVASPEEVDAVLEQAVAAGGTLVKPGAEAEWGGYSGYFADPDGHLWEVAWNPTFDLVWKPEHS